ncbi:hypothetical protein CTR2_R51150 [Comamonas thiooxydans]|uniref:hypothetical protein n=1 Tax=Comamonas thiooxydans TaxID=363952 RepID=UPI000A2D723C|nr:hypothetical protein [Comamonas thiooxydans]BDR11777.1 hypothetical protein CTR2_R51150 [Comamonas thiooxydans]
MFQGRFTGCRAVSACFASHTFDKRCCSLIGNLVNDSHYGDPRNVMLKLRGSF